MTLATEDDQMIATNKWPAMKLDKGLQVGSKGGHGPIKYFVSAYEEDHSITFQFDLAGFDGYHKFELSEFNGDNTELIHTINMTTTGFATIRWILAIRWLHDAYIEDAFDKVENKFAKIKKRTEWSWWVKTLRQIFKPK